MTRVNIEVDNEQYTKIAAATNNRYIKDYIIEILKKKAEDNKTKWQ